MKNIKDILKKKGRNLILLAILLFLLNTFLFWCLNMDGSITGLLKNKCIIDSASDVQKCKAKNPYVKISFDAVYNTSYVYQENEQTVAYYLDIDLEGKSLISLVDSKTAEKLLKGEQKYIEGKLVTFSDVHLDSLAQIKQYYISEGISAVYIDTQFSNYEIAEGSFYLIIVGIMIGSIIFILGKGIYMVMKPEKNSYYRKYQDQIEKIEGELNSNYQYESKNVIITEHYIFHDTKFSFQIYPLEDIKWAYQKNIKRYGMTINKSIIIHFVDGKNMTIPFKQKEALNHFGKDVLIGYTPENAKQYRETVKQYKASHK